MDETVVYLKPNRLRSRDWTNEEVAAFYRVQHILTQSGLHIEIDKGLTDEGDPWLAFCTNSDCEIFAHFARINGQYIVEAPVLNMEMKASSFSGLVANFLQLFPAVPATRSSTQQSAQHGKANKLQIHPSALLTALITTLLMLTKMTQEAEAGTLTSHDSTASLDIQTPQATDFASLVGEVFYPAESAAAQQTEDQAVSDRKIKEVRANSSSELRADFIVNAIAMASIVMPMINEQHGIMTSMDSLAATPAKKDAIKQQQLLEDARPDALAIAQQVDMVVHDSYTNSARTPVPNGSIGYEQAFSELPHSDQTSEALMDGIYDFTDLLASFTVNEPASFPHTITLDHPVANQQLVQNISLDDENVLDGNVLDTEPPEPLSENSVIEQASPSPLLIEIFGDNFDLTPFLISQSEQTDAAVALVEKKFDQQPVEIVIEPTEPAVIAEPTQSDISQIPEISVNVSFDWGELNPFEVILSFLKLGDDVLIFQSPTQTYLIESDFLDAPEGEIIIEEFHFEDDTSIYLVGVQDTFNEIESALL